MQRLCLWLFLVLAHWGLAPSSIYANARVRRGIEPVHRPQRISSFSPGGQYVLLTFSNGPHPSLTPRILDVLAQFKAKASFFVYGQRALHHADIAQRIAREGHDLAHQGFFVVPHPRSALAFDRLSAEAAGKSIAQATELLRNLTQTSPRFFRAPFGAMAAQTELQVVLGEQRMHHVLWSLNSGDRGALQDGVPSADKVVRAVTQAVKPGDVVLFHDTQTVLLEALPIILQNLLDAGYEFLTLSDMMSFPDDSPH